LGDEIGAVVKIAHDAVNAFGREDLGRPLLV
jgi:hypothetical protein